MTGATATIEWFNCDQRRVITGRIAKRYPNGLSVIGPRDMVFYADNRHVLDDGTIEPPRGEQHQGELFT